MHALMTITGNVGTEIELRGGGQQEWAYAQFRVACTPRTLKGGSWRDGETVWLGVTCRNRALAEHVKASVGKGDPVIVMGRLITSTFTRDGQVHERLILDALVVGHDLNRGTSAFRRVDRASQEQPSPAQLDADLEEKEAALAVGAAGTELAQVEAAA